MLPARRARSRLLHSRAAADPPYSQMVITRSCQQMQAMGCFTKKDNLNESCVTDEVFWRKYEVTAMTALHIGKPYTLLDQRCRDEEGWRLTNQKCGAEAQQLHDSRVPDGRWVAGKGALIHTQSCHRCLQKGKGPPITSQLTKSQRHVEECNRRYDSNRTWSFAKCIIQTALKCSA